MSSSHLTNIFQRGRYTTNQLFQFEWKCLPALQLDLLGKLPTYVGPRFPFGFRLLHTFFLVVKQINYCPGPNRKRNDSIYIEMFGNARGPPEKRKNGLSSGHCFM